MAAAAAVIAEMAWRTDSTPIFRHSCEGSYQEIAHPNDERARRAGQAAMAEFGRMNWKPTRRFSPAIRGRAIGMVIALCAVLAVAAADMARAAEPTWVARQPSIVGVSGTREHALLGDRIPGEIGRVIDIIKANRPPRERISQAMLLTGAGGREYLALSWSGLYLQRAEFHRIDRGPSGSVRATFVREIKNGRLDFLEPSGRSVFPDEPTVVVVDERGGGSASNNHITVIQMKRNTVDIVPAELGNPIGFRDLDGDGSHELITEQRTGGWSLYHVGCATCTTRLAIVYERRQGRFVPACKKHQQTIRADIDAAERWLGPSRGVGMTAAVLVSNALRHAQIGDFDSADEALRRAATTLHRTDELRPVASREQIDYVETVMAGLIDQARMLSDHPCPVAALSQRLSDVE